MELLERLMELVVGLDGKVDKVTTKLNEMDVKIAVSEEQKNTLKEHLERLEREVNQLKVDLQKVKENPGDQAMSKLNLLGMMVLTAITNSLVSGLIMLYKTGGH